MNLLHKYGLKPTTQRELSLFTLSIIARGYCDKIKPLLGFSYRAVGGLGKDQYWYSLMNEQYVAEETGKLFSKKSCRDILHLARKEIQYYLKNIKDSDDPKIYLRNIITFFPRYMAGMGIYNCFWRYMGNNAKKLPQDIIQIVTREREAAAKLYPEVEKEIQQAMAKIGNAKQLRNLTCAELAVYLKTGRVKKHRRADGYFYVYDGKDHISDNQKLIKEIETELFTTSSTTFVKGHPAFIGTVRGKVFNAYQNKGKQEFKPGMILVIPSAHPKDNHLIMKAAAIVADEGGILSHAAVVAREKKIPTIIGTINATRVFADGEEIEVDAKKGIVRKIPKIAGNDWLPGVTRNASFFHQVLSAQGHYDDAHLFGVLKNMQLWITHHGAHTTIFLESKTFRQYEAEVMQLLLSKKRLEQLEKTYKQQGTALLTAAKRLSNLNKKNWEYFVEKYKQYTPGLFITTIIGRHGQEQLLKEGLDESTIATITFPDEVTPFMQAQFDLLNNCRKNDYFKTWHEKWKCLPVNFNERPIRLSDAKQKVQAVLRQNPEVELQRLKAEHHKMRMERNRLLIGCNSRVKQIAFAVQKGTYLNEYRKFVFSRASFRLQEIFQKIAGTDWRCCYYLTPNEIETLLSGKKINLRQKAKEREWYGGVLENGKVRILTSEEIELVKHMMPKKEDNHHEDMVKGFPANKGVVRGQVKIILGSRDFSKFRENDILVAPMTSVDFVPIMEKAAAFVTNEGGLTSHAAIVSREMNKPCVIGTKYATKVFHDGDYVEVDANKGIVKKLP